MVQYIRCAECRFAHQDKNASEYARKRCRTCELREVCEVCRDCEMREECKARLSPKRKQSCERRLDTICSQQTLKWTAIQCANPKSEYHRALLNVTPDGDMLPRITWEGCPLGERRDS